MFTVTKLYSPVRRTFIFSVLRHVTASQTYNISSFHTSRRYTQQIRSVLTYLTCVLKRVISIGWDYNYREVSLGFHRLDDKILIFKWILVCSHVDYCFSNVNNRIGYRLLLQTEQQKTKNENRDASRE